LLQSQKGSNELSGRNPMFNKRNFSRVLVLLFFLFMSCKAPPPSVIKDSLDTGNLHFEKGHYDKAITSYSMVTATLRNSTDPNLATAYYNRGLAYFMKDDYNKAIEDFSLVIAINPRDDLAYRNRGNARVREKHYDEAIEDFNMAIKIKPLDLNSHYSLGMIYFRKQQCGKTVEILSRAIALNPSFAKAYNGRGQAYMRSGNIENAISDFQKACKMGENCGCIMLELISKKKE